MKHLLFRLLLSALITLLAFSPTWLTLLFYRAASPGTFWETFAIGALALAVLGGVQFALLVMWVVAMFFTWNEL